MGVNHILVVVSHQHTARPIHIFVGQLLECGVKTHLSGLLPVNHQPSTRGSNSQSPPERGSMSH